MSDDIPVTTSSSTIPAITINHFEVDPDDDSYMLAADVQGDLVAIRYGDINGQSFLNISKMQLPALIALAQQVSGN